MFHKVFQRAIVERGRHAETAVRLFQEAQNGVIQSVGAPEVPPHGFRPLLAGAVQVRRRRHDFAQVVQNVTQLHFRPGRWAGIEEKLRFILIGGPEGKVKATAAAHLRLASWSMKQDFGDQITRLGHAGSLVGYDEVEESARKGRVFRSDDDAVNL